MGEWVGGWVRGRGLDSVGEGKGIGYWAVGGKGAGWRGGGGSPCTFSWLQVG